MVFLFSLCSTLYLCASARAIASQTPRLSRLFCMNFLALSSRPDALWMVDMVCGCKADLYISPEAVSLTNSYFLSLFVNGE